MHKPLFLKKSKETLPQTLNNYEVIRDKVVNDFQTKGPIVIKAKEKQVKVTEKKKLLDF